MHARLVPLYLGLCLWLCACGYQWQGFETPSSASVLGDGSMRVRIVEVEQPTLYPWVSPFIRSLVRDEIQLRKLARMVDSEPAEYTLHIRLPYFRVRAYISDSDDQSILNAASTAMEMEVRRETSGEIVWRSGLVQYSERYVDPREEVAVRAAIEQVVSRLMDRMQQNF